MTAPPPGSALAEAVTTAAALLAMAEVPSPRFDAEELAAHVAGVARGQLWRTPDFPPGGAGRYELLVRRRIRREPLQHLTGTAPFRHVELAVGPGVFVPRPETEVVAGAAIEELLRSASRPPRAVDLCTGSGAIALSIATEVPGAQIHAVELGGSAYDWAQRNLAGSGVELRRGDMAEAFPELDGTVDVVVSNPPYIPLGSVIRDPEVAEHDPALALWSGADGLDALRVVSRVARRLLRPGGLVVAEHADLQGESAPAVLRADGWDEVADHRDLAGRPRYVSGRLGAPTMTA